MNTSTIDTTTDLRHAPDPVLKHWVKTGSLSLRCNTFLGVCFFCKGTTYKYTAWGLVELESSRLRCPVCKSQQKGVFRG